MKPLAHKSHDINASQISTTLQPLKDLYLVAMVTDCACQAYKYKSLADVHLRLAPLISHAGLWS